MKRNGETALIKNMLFLPELKSDPKLVKAAVFNKSILPSLEKNQVIDAKVIKLLSPDKAELLLLGRKVVAETPNAANFSKGDTIQLRVTEQGQLTILKVIPESVISKPLSNSTQLSNPSKLLDLSQLLKSSSLQFFAANQPFEGFKKLVSTLFSDNKTVINASLKEQIINNSNEKSISSSNEKSISSSNEKIISRLNQQIKIEKAIEDIKNLLISTALKSDKPDLNFLPNLLDKSGLLMEKKLTDTLKNEFIPSPHIFNPKSNTLINNNANSASVDINRASINTTKNINPHAVESQNKTSSTNTTENINPHAFESQNKTPSLDVVTINEPIISPRTPEAFIKNDIKGAVLSFIADSGEFTGEAGLDALENQEPSNIHIFKEFIHNLENVQLLNSHLSESGKYIIPFPMLNGEHLTFGQLFIDLGQKDKESSSSKENSLLRVSIFLDMTNLGPIRADFSVLKNNITGTFQVSDKETSDFFKIWLPELKERLKIHDYNIHKIECRVVDPEKLSEKSIINELLKSEEHGLNIMI